MRDTNFGQLGIGIEEHLRAIIEINGQHTQLESAMYLLDGLLGWCEVCFNSDVEVEDYKKLSQAYKLLEEVHKSYDENYN
jgi:hypothetical protein